MIRKATARDLPSLLKLYDHLRGGLAWVQKKPTLATPEHRRALAQILRDRHHQILVAVERGQVVGTCTLYILPRVYWSGRPWAILDSIVVAEEHQGRGTGTRLIRYAIKTAKAHKCSQINLTSNTQRIRAHRFYESLGFEPTYIGFKMMF